jgi:hypothetical protein
MERVLDNHCTHLKRTPFPYIEKWAQLMAALFECSRSPSAELRESALRIFTAVPDLISDQHNDALKGVFSASLADPESQNVSATLAMFERAYIKSCSY